MPFTTRLWSLGDDSRRWLDLLVNLHCSEYSVDSQRGGYDFSVTQQTYTCGYQVTLEEIEDSDVLKLTEELEKRAQAARESLAARLYSDTFGTQEVVVYSWWQHFRQWLGWKLWKLAGKVNPEVF